MHEAEKVIDEHLHQLLPTADFTVQVILAAGRKPVESSQQATESPAAASESRATNQFVPTPLTLEQFQRAVVSQFEHLHRELAKITAVNAELNRQLEQLKAATPDKNGDAAREITKPSLSP